MTGQPLVAFSFRCATDADFTSCSLRFGLIPLFTAALDNAAFYICLALRNILVSQWQAGSPPCVPVSDGAAGGFSLR